MVHPTKWRVFASRHLGFYPSCPYTSVQCLSYYVKFLTSGPALLFFFYNVFIRFFKDYIN